MNRRWMESIIISVGRGQGNRIAQNSNIIHCKALLHFPPHVAYPALEYLETQHDWRTPLFYLVNLPLDCWLLYGWTLT
jgi:hypothetical protein